MIQTATVADARAIAEVHISSWRSTYRGIVPLDYLDQLDLGKRIEMWEKILSKKDPNEVTFVASESNKVVGFACMGPNRDQSQPFDGELYAIYLSDAYHRRGIGRQLFNASVEQFKLNGPESMLVWVLKDNPTCGFYEKMGGKFIAEKEEKIGGKVLREWAYGWPDLGVF